MSSFVTGATGFIGRHLVEHLLRREGTIHVLVREASLPRLEERLARWSAVDPAARDRVVPVLGDLERPGLGLAAEDVDALRGVRHVVHLGAVYDMTAPDARNEAVNLAGTRHLVEVANDL